MPMDGTSLNDIILSYVSLGSKHLISNTENDPFYEKAKDECKSLIHCLLASREAQIITPTPLIPSVDPLIICIHYFLNRNSHLSENG